MSRIDTSKKFTVKNMGASQTFNFNGSDFEQVVIHNTNTPDVYLRDENNNDFVIKQGVSFNLSTIPSKAISGLTVVTQSGGTASIAYLA